MNDGGRNWKSIAKLITIGGGVEFAQDIDNEEYVTWVTNKNGDRFSGHYLLDYSIARKDFLHRIDQELKINKIYLVFEK